MTDNGKTIYQGFAYALGVANGLTVGKSYSAALYLKSTNKRFLAKVNGSDNETSAQFTEDGSLSFKWHPADTTNMDVGVYDLEIFSADKEEIYAMSGFNVVPSNLKAGNI